MLLPLPTSQICFTFTLLLGSSVLLRIPERSEYHPFAQSTVVSALSLTKLQQHGTNSPLLPVTHPLQFLQIFLENLSISENFFFSPPALRCLYVSRCVFVCGCVGVCLCVCVQARVHVFSVCVFKLLTSKYMHVLNL